MKTYSTNCILTFSSGPQVFLDLPLPLEAGEAFMRSLFGAVAMAYLAGEEQSNRGELVKVSMCATIPKDMTSEEMDTHFALTWFKECNGKIYFE